MSADLQVIGIALACSAVAALTGVPLLRLLRVRPLWATAGVLCVVPILAVAVGVAGTARAMFLSRHDLRVVLIVVAVSAVVATAAAVRLGRPVVAATGSLTRAADTLGDPAYQRADRIPTAELTALACTLDATHVRLVEARDRERALEASRRELVAWISHDLRTPLAGIRATAEALADGLVTDARTTARYHRQMLADAERLTGMVDDLFELARLQAGALELTLEKVCLADIVSDAVATVDPIARARRVVVTGRADDAVYVDADAAQVSRALINLLVNAIRHTPDDGTVEVRVERERGAPRGDRPAGPDDGRAIVAVADRCGGIPAGDLPRLFDLGFRGETARTPGDGGDHPHQPRIRSGIGLAIVRGIVEAHGGDVTVHNQRDGCRFVVALPAA
ncbi:HAMP domain-containing histidine kinase [Frankia sp. CNm7]|uniref:histidine kinase n=1 Tax=Frankia nepalensis TaxID=1836974 RepID=A0A937RIE9_9ACTN|nr:HAMP domain-containing sensor histidine kinase [Frankia nepalensis]MBL7498961.1 HAMP domain-containing histidine kinase [Frankia nepalensis]MBL7511242.1 HAMP domain-containing histidine kinase [Frankia nepalensis]MBL7520584.1 HAMP domain-containing histidine kinase [Frankia nepalensis]MBL7630762.1 HAMP domain-containing histidine kinase [Frankia nepalensis]